jgi:hypothetical protein
VFTGSVLGAATVEPANNDTQNATVPPTISVPEGKAIELPEQVLKVNQALLADLHAFICDERINRYKGSRSGTNARQIDTVTSKLAFENGSEHYTQILQNKKPLAHISNLSGAWSEGEYGTLLQQTKNLFASKPMTFRQNTLIDGVPAAIYSFDLDAHETPWDLTVRSKAYKIPFRTYVWVSEETAQILKIARVSTSVPEETHIAELTWFITLQKTDLSGKTYLVPKAGQYAVTYEDSQRVEWNVITFSDYHRFGAEATLRFDSPQ